MIMSTLKIKEKLIMNSTKKLFFIVLVICILFNTVSCAALTNKNQHTDFESESLTDINFSDNAIKNESEDAPTMTDNSNKNDLKRYSLIADKNNSLALSAAAELNAKLSKLGYSLPINQSSVYEIIIGNSSAPETIMAIEQLKKSSKDYIIQFAGKKIVIMAKNDQALSEACGIFYDKYIAPLKSSTINYKDGTTTYGTAKTLATLAFDKAAQYSIVFSGVSSEVNSKITVLAEKIKTVTGISSITVGDTYNASKNQIIVGKSSHLEVLKALDGLKENEYVLSKINNKIVIAGNTDKTTILAIEKFINLLTEAKTSNPTEGTFTMAIPSAIINAYCANLPDIPKYPNATYSATYPSGSGISQLYYKNASSAGIDNYVKQIENLGYKKTEDRSLNGNRFVTCYGDNGLVHISYLAYNKSLTVILDSLNGSIYKESEPTYTKVTDTSLAVMSLDYSSLSNQSDASGMSYVITLEDGRYIIIDGGYYKKTGGKDHHILFNYLKDNNKRKDGKIVIAAWILTHDHSDHHGAFTNFAQEYASRVELQYYITNFGDKSRYNQQPSGWLNTNIPNELVANYYKNAKKIVPHTGQRLTFCNTTFDVICSQESHAPNKMEWVNDASLIFRMTANGVKTLFLADAEAQTTNLLNNMYGSTLKSDIMQIAHHGYSGGSVSLYQNVAPNWTLWPTNQTCFNERTTGGGIGNAQSQNKWARNNSTCYVADGNIEILKFVGGTSKISVTTYTPNKNKT